MSPEHQGEKYAGRTGLLGVSRWNSCPTEEAGVGRGGRRPLMTSLTAPSASPALPPSQRGLCFSPGQPHRAEGLSQPSERGHQRRCGGDGPPGSAGQGAKGPRLEGSESLHGEGTDSPAGGKPRLCAQGCGYTWQQKAFPSQGVLFMSVRVTWMFFRL